MEYHSDIILYLTGEDNHICRFGGCRLITYVPWPPNFKVRTPFYNINVVTGAHNFTENSTSKPGGSLHCVSSFSRSSKRTSRVVLDSLLYSAFDKIDAEEYGRMAYGTLANMVADGENSVFGVVICAVPSLVRCNALLKIMEIILPNRSIRITGEGGHWERGKCYSASLRYCLDPPLEY